MTSSKKRQFWVVTNPLKLCEEAGSVSISSILSRDLHEEFIRSLKGRSFSEGVEFPPDAIARVSPSKSGAYWDFWDMFGGWIAVLPLSERLMDELPGSVQVFPIQSAISSLEEDYRVVNFTRSADCLDYARSDYVPLKWDPKEMCAIWHLALCEDSLPPFPIFRPKGASHYLLADDEGKAALMRAGVTEDYFKADFCSVVPGPRSPIPEAEPEPERRALDPTRVVDYSAEHIDAVLEILRKFHTPKEAWRAILAYCKKVAPHAAWSQFSRPALSRDIADATLWLRRQLDHLPAAGLIYLGLDTLNMADGAGKNVEIGASESADAEDDSGEWVLGDLKYGQDFLIKGLVKMHKLYQSDEWAECFGFCDYILFLAYSGIVLSNACRAVFVDSPIRVTWGFHDGDMFKLGRIELGGFQPMFTD